MNEISMELNIIFEKIKENNKILKFSGNNSFMELKKICDASTQMVSILEFEQNAYSLHYSNKGALNFLGVNEADFKRLGFEFVLKTTHPDNMDSIYMLIKFFNDANNHHNTFTHTLYIHTKKGYEWLYSMVKPATFNKDGTIKYMIAIACSLDDLLDTRNQTSSININNNLYNTNLVKYNSLSEREKEVLKFIAEEMTSKEIAAILFISPLTVDTHRKHLIEKLEVKSSIGLIKYALIFNLI